MRPKKERDFAHDASIARAGFCAQLAVNDKLSYALSSALRRIYGTANSEQSDDTWLGCILRWLFSFRVKAGE